MSDDVIIHLNEEPDTPIVLWSSGAGPAGPTGPAGPAGPAGTGGRYEHTQLQSLAVWEIVHNLGAVPSAVSIVDSAGTIVFGKVSHGSINNCTVMFSAPFSGKAYLST